MITANSERVRELSRNTVYVTLVESYLTSARNLTINVCLWGIRVKLARPSTDMTHAEPFDIVVIKHEEGSSGQQHCVTSL